MNTDTAKAPKLTAAQRRYLEDVAANGRPSIDHRSNVVAAVKRAGLVTIVGDTLGYAGKGDHQLTDLGNAALGL